MLCNQLELFQTIAENPESFYILDDLGRSTYYIAFNLNTDPDIIDAIQTELDAMKTDPKDERNYHL